MSKKWGPLQLPAFFRRELHGKSGQLRRLRKTPRTTVPSLSQPGKSLQTHIAGSVIEPMVAFFRTLLVRVRIPDLKRG